MNMAKMKKRSKTTTRVKGARKRAPKRAAKIRVGVIGVGRGQSFARGATEAVGRVCGFVSKAGAGVGRSSNDRQFWFVNGRPVDVPKLVRVVNEVWRAYEMKHKPALYHHQKPSVNARRRPRVKARNQKRSVSRDSDPKLQSRIWNACSA